MTLIWVLQFSSVIFFLWSKGFAKGRHLSENDMGDIDRFIEAAMSCRHIPGLSLAVVNKDDVLIQKGYGYADMQRSKMVNAKTLFPIASTTKAFTTTLLAMILEETRFDWDTPIKEMDEKFQLHTDLLTNHVTLRDILTHRTGIPGYFIALMAGYPEDMPMEEIIRNFHYHPPIHPLRTEFQYNNFMYALAGYIAELLTNEKWEDLISERILKPLNMTSSTFVSKIDISSQDLQMAKPYIYKHSETMEADLTTIRQVVKASPAGSIISNAEDMAKWLQFHLREGQTSSGANVLSGDVIRNLYNTPIGGPLHFPPDIKRPDYPISDVSQNYALGWINNVYRGYHRIWHSGGILTYRTQVWLLPDLESGIFLVVNGPQTSDSSWAIIHIAQYITDKLSGEEPWMNTSTVCTYPSPWKNPVKRSPKTLINDAVNDPLEYYTGVYTHPAFGEITIFVNETNNKLQMKMGLFIEATLHYNNADDTFVTSLMNKYWYLSDRIPLQFGNKLTLESGCKFSELKMPLCQPYQTALKIAFSRDLNRDTKSSSMRQGFVGCGICHNIPNIFIYYVPITIWLLWLH